jgi:glycogen operon protein
LDNETTWLDWNLHSRNQDVFRFFSKMIAFRKAHPSISRSRFWRDDVRWYGATGRPDLSSDSHSLAFFLSGAAHNDNDIYAMINAGWNPLTFIIQRGQPAEWLQVIDTSLSPPA